MRNFTGDERPTRFRRLVNWLFIIGAAGGRRLTRRDKWPVAKDAPIGAMTDRPRRRCWQNGQSTRRLPIRRMKKWPETDERGWCRTKICSLKLARIRLFLEKISFNFKVSLNFCEFLFGRPLWPRLPFSFNLRNLINLSFVSMMLHTVR